MYITVSLTENEFKDEIPVLIMEKKYHLSQSLAGLEWLVAAGKTIDWLENEDGSQATMEEIRAAIVDAKAKGYIVLPPCNNVDSAGRCAGHDIR